MAIYRARHGHPHFDWEAFYPLRTILLGQLALSLLCAQCITLTECVKLIRHSLRPGKLLRLELAKIPIWLIWATVIGLSFINLVEKDEASMTFGIVLIAVHTLGFFVLCLPIPYAALMYFRDRRGYYGERKSSGWGYENGLFVEPEDPTDEEGDEDTPEETDQDDADDEDADDESDEEEMDGTAQPEKAKEKQPTTDVSSKPKTT
ncbi:hypothetical protein BDZ85DRAFT_248873 [Elsinoe ampelina]|uniref:Uncharacterized protein n=1 Tax=Elsinoe ampelina TaxID=302913 RepID=A0A6A6GF34_9PEZI|nr:hypothetical protein BDZ85DRAFT_248873 [Elsinoe ampelina]